ncbi:UNKNOWN [Stylonychia lemnae]|uniref:Uncharacterized protein n=1 Tax=Stylonychia lemnae TaxID=5949 RepID=A0A078APX4_STYLE|nr:UNKNOWN [Stylonychia lemnae]|eukprot:CDW84219.1 UNKNOWN [Stylonychia lemnae]
MLRGELLPYFEYQDIIKMIYLCKLVKETVKDHFQSWKNLSQLIASRYSIDADQILEYESLQEFKHAQKLIKVKETRFTYRRFKEQNSEILVYAGEIWSWKEDLQYWSMEDRQDSTFGLPVPYLKTVCWFDAFCCAEKVEPAVYNVYLINGVKLDPQSRHGFAEQVKLSINKEIKVGEEMKAEEMYTTKYIPKEIYHKFPTDKLTRTPITRIDLSQEKQDVTVKLIFSQLNDWWKGDYLLEGFVLEKLPQEKKQQKKQTKGFAESIFGVIKDAVDPNHSTPSNMINQDKKGCILM